MFGFLSALAPNFSLLVLLRALTGFGVGGTLPVDYAIFAEYLPREKRGRYLVLLESFWALGTIVAAGLAWLLVPRLGWRWLLAVSALPGAGELPHPERRLHLSLRHGHVPDGHPGRSRLDVLLQSGGLGRPVRLHTGAVSDRGPDHGHGMGQRDDPHRGRAGPSLGGYLLPLSLTLALTVYAVAFLVGGLTVLALGRETRGQPLADVVPAVSGG